MAHELVKLLKSNSDFEIKNYTDELQKLQVGDLDALLYHIWRLPKWKKQVNVIQTIIDNLPSGLFVPLLKLVSYKLDEVASDRKDKFYYLLGLLLDRIEIDKSNLETILTYSGDSTLSYYWRIILTKLDLEDKEVKRFLLEYTAYCPPHLLSLFEGVQLDTAGVKEFLKRDNLGYPNRAFLGKKLVNKTNYFYPS